MFLIERLQKEKNTDLVIFSRDANGEKKVNIIKTFKPYFFFPEDSIVPDDNRITSVEIGFKSILGEPVKKIYVCKSTDVADIREFFPKHYEADILFTRRYIINEIGPIEAYPLKVLYLDIETNTDDEFPDMNNPNQEVTCISLIDSFEKKTRTLLLRPISMKDKIVDLFLEVFDTEEELLGAFINYIREIDPDIITGWNVERFDLTYLIRRMQKFDIDPNRMSPLNMVKIDDKYGDSNLRVSIKGRIVLDMMKTYSHFRGVSNQGRAESYSLDFISGEVLGDAKMKHTESFSDLWKNNPKKLIEYNQHDVLLTKRINEKLDLVNFFNKLRCKSCSLITDVFQESVLIDGLLLRKLHNKLVLPSRPKITEEEKFSGAYVIPPIPGIYSNVFWFDVAGMYPSIIKSFNISYETFNPNGEIKIEDVVAFNKTKGIIPEIIEELDIERNYYKKLMKEADNEPDRLLNYYNQYIMKVFQNSFFGYLGFPKGRLYKKPIANAITTIGRRLLNWIKIVAENKGYKVLYGDTDSCAIQGKTSSLFDLMQEGIDLQAQLNNSFDNFTKSYGLSEHTLQLEFEKLIKTILFVAKKGEEEGAKKKYAYIPLWLSKKSATNEVEYTGFSSVRSDSPRIARKTEKKVIEMVLNNESKETIVLYISDIIKKFRKKEFSDVEIGFPKGISNALSSYGVSTTSENGKRHKVGTPPVIQGCLYSNKFLGTRFGKGSKPKWIYVKSVPLGFPNTRIISYTESIPEGFIPDYDIMIEKIFKAKLEEIFKAANLGEFPIFSENKKLGTWGF